MHLNLCRQGPQKIYHSIMIKISEENGTIRNILQNIRDHIWWVYHQHSTKWEDFKVFSVNSIVFWPLTSMSIRHSCGTATYMQQKH